MVRIVVVAIMLALPLATDARRVRRDDNTDSTSSLAVVNQSRTHNPKAPLWETIDELDTSIQFFDDSEVVGTLGFRPKGFNKMSTVYGSQNLELTFSDSTKPAKITNRPAHFIDGYEKRDGQVLLFQGTEDSLFDFSGPRPDLLEAMATKLQDVRFTTMVKVAGHEKKGIWFGSPVTPIPVVDPKDPLSVESAWTRLCPKGAQQTARKMVIPLEYNSFTAQTSNFKTGLHNIPFEEAHSNSQYDEFVNDPKEIVQTKRLLGFRRALLYFKYKCDDKAAAIQKVSIMLSHERKAQYEVLGRAWETPPTFHDAV